MRKYLVLLLLFFATVSLYSQEDNRRELNSYGFFAGVNYNFHSASFTQLPGYRSCCPEYTFAEGIGLGFGFLMDFQTNSILEYSGLDIRLSFDMLDAEFNESEVAGNSKDFLDLNDPNNTVTDDVIVNHNIVAGISLLSLEPTFRYSPIYDMNLHLGFKFGIPVASSFNQKETINSPDYVVFDDTKTFNRNLQSADEIPEINGFQFFITTGIGYEFPLNEKLYMVPELRLNIPFTNVNSTEWKANHLRINVAFKYYPLEDDEKPVIIDTTYSRDTVIVEELQYPNITEPVISLTDRDVSVEETETENEIQKTYFIKEKYTKKVPIAPTLTARIEGQINDVTQIVIEETETEESFPLLPHVFFERGDSELSNTSQRLLTSNETSEFSEKEMPWETLKIYNNLLNIVGKRLKENPGTDITIVGANNNTGIEENNRELSKNRAEAVKKYLNEVWGINPERIKIDHRDLPEIPGNPETDDGIVENQRAEIHTDNFEILKPIYLSDIIKKADPPDVKIKPVVETNNEENKFTYKLNISQGDQTLRQVSSDEISGEEYNWNVLTPPAPELDDNVKITLEAKDEYGNTAYDEKETELDQLTIRKKRYELKDDKRIERFALIVFDFDKAELSGRHKKILNEIKDRIEPDSEVIIEGYTDRIGTPEYNKKLAERRAIQVYEYLGVSENNSKLKAIGQDKLLYNNDLPQGRSYSRTVLVTIKTPVEE